MKLTKLDTISWADFSDLKPDDKADYLSVDNKIFHMLLAQQFDREQLEQLGDLATRIRKIAKTKEGLIFLRNQLPHKRAMLYFTQPSTRTFLSFTAACQILGITIGEVRDKSMSSEFKGETQDDSFRSFSSYFDLIIMRSATGGLAERMAWALSNSERPVPIINAGSGKDQHPTQALLDIYTLQRSFENSGGVDGKHIVFVGDLARGRTVRSLSMLLTNYKEIKITFVAPNQLQVTQDVQDLLTNKGVEYKLSNNFRSIIPQADAIYMTRIQDEWDTTSGESANIDTSNFHFGLKELELLKPTAVIMHPLPRRNEIATEVDADPRAVYWRQMRNGMWIRAALIASIFDCDEDIKSYK
ncbi:MAG: aspartate carbamoyltransferase [Kiritimatiellae bacterium]|nr:aspartate carbamoyltransferase [Kiritimatiellia bacterium]